jgi:ubiquinone biosynthesis protein
MGTTRDATPAIRRVMVGTDRSETADRAVRWAANLANPLGAELLVVQVLLPSEADSNADDDEGRVAAARETLHAFATELAGPRGRAQVVVDADPVQAILDAVAREKVDVLVVGNVGMSGRKEFLLGNVPNRISHNARCTVIIVNTALPQDGAARRPRADDAAPETEGQLMRRAAKIARILAQAGAKGLLSHAPGGDEDAARAMAQELQVPWEDVFASIDPRPLAAGTIAQVHRATLESGERVVVKVQRPNAERDILQDVALLEMFAQRAAARPGLRRVFDIPAMIEHLTSSLRRTSAACARCWNRTTGWTCRASTTSSPPRGCS